MSIPPDHNIPRVRRRRSDRHRKDEGLPLNEIRHRATYQPDEGAAPAPLQDDSVLTQEPDRRNAPVVYDYEEYPPDTRFDTVDPEAQELRRVKHPTFIAIGVLILFVIAFFCVFYFWIPPTTQGMAGKIRKPIAKVMDKLMGVEEKQAPKLIKFETAEAFSVMGVDCIFTFTTDVEVDDVRIMDESGMVFSGIASSKNPPENTVWTLNVIFEKPFEGIVHAGVFKDDVWYPGGKSLSIMVTEPTPEPTLMPTPEPLTNTPPLAVTPEPNQDVAELDSLTEDVPEEVPTPDVLGETNQDAKLVFQEEPATPFPGQTPVFVPVVTVVTQPPITQEGSQGKASSFEQNQDAQETQASEAEDAQDADMPEAQDDPQPQPQVTSAPAKQPKRTLRPFPALIAQASEETDPSRVGLAETIYKGSKALKDFQRENPFEMPMPADYTSYEGGVFTFRGDHFRQNAAFGTVDVRLKQLSIAWSAEMGSMRISQSPRVVRGMGWTGQPAIVKWYQELRGAMNISEEKKAVKALKEVIFASQDGKVYFLDLNDGVETRKPIDIGFPLKGSVSVDAAGRPIIAFGQGISQLPGKTGWIGLHLYNLLDQSKLFNINGRKNKQQKQYGSNGAFDGTALFDWMNDRMVIGGENGLFYTVDLNTEYDYQNLEAKKLSTSPTIHYLMSKGKKQQTSRVSIEASPAMFRSYAYVADTYGYLRCIDTSKMQTVWLADCGDNTDATPALDFQQGDQLFLYTGNTVFTRLKGKKMASIRKLDAMTGKELWKVDVPCNYDKTERAGCKASPIVGQQGIRDLVIFTVNKVKEGGAIVLALHKDTGHEIWRRALNKESISSPVAVYNEQGEAWIIQADESGRLTMLEGRTGEVVSVLELEDEIEGSPAVYNDMLVIGTCGKEPTMYGIRIE